MSNEVFMDILGGVVLVFVMPIGLMLLSEMF